MRSTQLNLASNGGENASKSMFNYINYKFAKNVVRHIIEV